MRLLLDTHIFICYIAGDPRLAAAFRDAIRDPSNEAYLSVASVWEAVVKYGLGKVPLPSPPAEYLPRQRLAHRIASLPIEEATLTRVCLWILAPCFCSPGGAAVHSQG